MNFCHQIWSEQIPAVNGFYLIAIMSAVFSSRWFGGSNSGVVMNVRQCFRSDWCRHRRHHRRFYYFISYSIFLFLPNGWVRKKDGSEYRKNERKRERERERKHHPTLLFFFPSFLPSLRNRNVKTMMVTSRCGYSQSADKYASRDSITWPRLCLLQRYVTPWIQLHRPYDIPSI